jgi:ABC-type transport system involved in cytochrome c biogenesis ATPase subunit
VSVPGRWRPSGLRDPAGELRGQRGESEVLNRLIDALRAGEGRTLVVGGEPGVGKTALLDYLVEHASGCRVARAAGDVRSGSMKRVASAVGEGASAIRSVHLAPAPGA